MENRDYEKPMLEELGQLRDVTGGGLFDIPDILAGLFGGGSNAPTGGSH